MNKECEKCEKCYVCESGVSPDITAEQMKELQEKGLEIPSSWFIEKPKDGCDSCFSCEKCFTAEGSCDSCFSCEKCFESQEKQGVCDSCFSCEKCFESQEEKCENCFSCEKCFQSQESDTSEQPRSVTYFFFPTNECNLRCDYCYAEKTPPVMDKKTVDSAIDFIMYEEPKRIKRNGLSIQFFGGEPTIQWDMLVYIVEQIRKIGQETNQKNIRFGMTTNGTLLNEDRISWMKKNKIMPLLSVDGRKETHNKHRVYANGKGSWDDIPFDTFLKYFPNPEIRPTILPDTVGDWIEDLKWFHSKGCYTVATEVAYEADWDDEAMQKAFKTYSQMAMIYVDLKKKGQKCWMKFIEDGKGFLGKKKQTGHVCGIARNSVAIDAKGDLYACQRYASFRNPVLILGNVFDGWDEVKLRQTNNFKREMMSPDPKSGFDC